MPDRCRSLVVAVTALLLTAVACTSNDGSSQTESAGGEVALFDSSVVHRIDVSFDEDDYDAMIKAYTETGTKEWIEATVTIDGTTYERVGMRLKGNSSLGGLGGGFGGGRPPQARIENGSSTSTGGPPTTNQTPQGGAAPNARTGGVGSASADTPEELPWLIRLDEFVQGQSHQGYEDVVVRSNGSETSLNEAVALDLLEEAGLASQDAAATSFSVNGRDAALRLAIEHPDDDAWQAENFEGDGALYKAESTGDWSYRGDEPSAYEEIWDQEGGSEVTDLTPLVDFLQFLNESDDQTFATELRDRLDVDAFARYLAMMELLANFDDIDGPGNNAYLWYDVATEQFTVVAWDLNLAFGGLGGGLGGVPPNGFAGGQPPEGFEPPEGFDPRRRPEGFGQGQLPDGATQGQRPEGQFPGGGQLPGGGGAGGFGRSNVLVERFHANAEFETLYQTQLTDLRAKLYGTELADDALGSWVETLTNHATDLVDAATVETEAAAISKHFTTS